MQEKPPPALGNGHWLQIWSYDILWEQWSVPLNFPRYASGGKRAKGYLLWRVRKVFHSWSISKRKNHSVAKARTNQDGPEGKLVKLNQKVNPRLYWEFVLEQREGALRQRVLKRATAGGQNEKLEKMVNGAENKTPSKHINFSYSGQLGWGKVYMMWLYLLYFSSQMDNE